ncbi:MAG: T9SS type A sorting domain-containing protein [Bacteroidia bacterium]
MKFRVQLLLLLFILTRISAHAQSISISVIGSYGNYNSISVGSLSSSLGEPMVSTRNASSNIITEGFEQPDDLLPLSIHNFIADDVDFKAYPNPFYNKLIIESTFFNKDVELIITDITGREILSIQNNAVFNNNDQLQIETSSFKSGVYFFTIIDKVTRKPMKIIKVIKA